MDIDEFINNILYSLFEKYNINSEFEKKEIIEKVKMLKSIAFKHNEFKCKTYEEKKDLIIKKLEDIISKFAALKENEDPIRKKYASIEGEVGYGKTLLEKKSLITGEDLEIAYCTIGRESIHLHCGISRKIDYIDPDGKEISHYHALLRNLKYYYSQKYVIIDKHEIEKVCLEKVIEPYILEILEKTIELCEKYPNLKTIRLDTNDGFFRQVSPVLLKYGFKILNENDMFHLEELSNEFPQYKFPGDLTKFYLDYPDRKNSVIIHKSDLKSSLENNRNMRSDSLYLKENVISSKIM